MGSQVILADVLYALAYDRNAVYLPFTCSGTVRR